MVFIKPLFNLLALRDHDLTEVLKLLSARHQHRPSGLSEKSGRQTVSFNYCTHIGYNRTHFDYSLQAIFNNSFTLRTYIRAPLHLSLAFNTSK